LYFELEKKKKMTFQVPRLFDKSFSQPRSRGILGRPKEQIFFANLGDSLNNRFLEVKNISLFCSKEAEE
jgi:hypothetical protein